MMEGFERIIEFPRENLTTLLISTVVLLLIYLKFSNGKKKLERLPPGPPNLPLVGSLPFLGKDIQEPLRKMAQKYGDMMTVYLGARQTVYLNTYDVIKEAFVKKGNLFSGRPQDVFWITELCESIGIIASEGELWRKQRRLIHTVLKDFGMGRGILEPKIHEEIQAFLQALENYNGESIDVYFTTMKAVANVIFSIVNGDRYDYDNEFFNGYVETMKEHLDTLSLSGFIIVFPFLRYLPGDALGIRKMFKTKDINMAEFRKMIEAHKESHDPENPRDLIDAYLTRMNEEQKVNPDTTFTERQLCQIIADLFGAGSEATSNSIIWSMVYMLHYPDVMKRCQAEIDDVLGPHGVASSKNKSLSLPYVEATLMEIMRRCTVSPYAIPHTNTEDMEFKGYYFPKGTNFVPNIYAVHMDPVTWPDPEVFNPSRHLTEEGKLFERKEFMPFGIGRRVCVGESLSKMELFLFFTSLLQKFDLVLPEGEPLPPLEGILGVTLSPHKFKIIFKKRLGPA